MASDPGVYSGHRDSRIDGQVHVAREPCRHEAAQEITEILLPHIASPRLSPILPPEVWKGAWISFLSARSGDLISQYTKLDESRGNQTKQRRKQE